MSPRFWTTLLLLLVLAVLYLGKSQTGNWPDILRGDGLDRSGGASGDAGRGLPATAGSTPPTGLLHADDALTGLVVRPPR